MPVFSMGLARHSVGRRVHLHDAILIYFAHLRVLTLHCQKRVTVEGIFLGCTTQVVESLADLLLQLVVHVVLVAEKDHAPLPD